MAHGACALVMHCADAGAVLRTHGPPHQGRAAALEAYVEGRASIY
jgi:hypothetical protein